MTFWTCGPFKEAHDRINIFVYRIEQTQIWMETLEESKNIEELMENGSPDEKLLAAMIKLDIDKKLEVLIGVTDGHEKKNDEISRETILKSLSGLTKK